LIVWNEIVPTASRRRLEKVAQLLLFELPRRPSRDKIVPANGSTRLLILKSSVFYVQMLSRADRAGDSRKQRTREAVATPLCAPPSNGETVKKIPGQYFRRFRLATFD
jgi:hypothetical protein